MNKKRILLIGFIVAAVLISWAIGQRLYPDGAPWRVEKRIEAEAEQSENAVGTEVADDAGVMDDTAETEVNDALSTDHEE